MSKVFELTIRDRDTRKVVHTATCNVHDDFEERLFNAYRNYYLDVTDDEVMYLRIVRGLVEGVMNNIAAAEAAPRFDAPLPPRFTIEGEVPVHIDPVELEPAEEEEEKPNAK